MRTVADILKIKGNEVKTVSSTQPVLDAITEMSASHIGALVVVDDGKVVGLISERDYTCKVALEGKTAKSTPVKDIMSKKLVVVKRETEINECMALMSKKHIRHLPVMDGDQLEGLVSIGDIVKEVINEQDYVIQQLEGYIYS